MRDDTLSDAALRAALARTGTLEANAAKVKTLVGCSAYARDLLVSGSTYDASYKALLLRECSLLFPGFGMGPDATRSRSDGFDYKLVDPLLSIAVDNNKAFAGGHLVWFQTIPKWIRETLTDRSAILAEMLLEVKTTMIHFAGKMVYWTVVNEAVDPTYRRQLGLRPSFWFEQLGPDYIAQAFTAAREADPTATLLLNENNLESDSPTVGRKREAVLNLLQTLRDARVPVDGLGLQAHLNGSSRVDQRGLSDFITAVRKLGLEIFITEFDVFDHDLPPETAARDASVASTARDFLDCVLLEPGVPVINFWGLSDNRSWYNSSRTPAALHRPDGLESRATPFDHDLAKKPFYSVVEAALKRAAKA